MSEPTTDFLTDVATYLASNGIGSVTGTVTNFAGLFPADPDNALGVLGNPGQAPTPYITEFQYPRFQVLVRDLDYDTGWQKLRSIRDLLHGQFGINTANYHALSIVADAEGSSLGQDTNGRHIFSINFKAEIRDGAV